MKLTCRRPSLTLSVRDSLELDDRAEILAALAAIESRLREGFSPRSAHPALDALVSRVSREVRAIDLGETTDDVNRLVFSLASFLFDRIRVQRQTDPTVAYLFKTEPPLPVEAESRAGSAAFLGG